MTDVLHEIGKICNAWVNGVLGGDDAMERIYRLVVEHGWERLEREDPERAREIETSLKEVKGE